MEDITKKRTAEQAQLRNAAIVGLSEDAMISESLDAVIESFNAGAERIFGDTESEAVGQPITILIPRELQDQDHKILERLRAGACIERYESIRITKAGKKINVYVSIAPINDLSGSTMGFLKIARDITEQKRAEAAFADVSRKMVEIQEKERMRIARDLHDDINQRLGLLAVQIEQLKHNSPASAAELNWRLTDVWEVINEVSREVQLISHQLHSPRLELLGVVAALKGFCREFASRHSVEIDFKNDDIIQPVRHEISLCLFRISQEALHNAARHSGVKQFAVRLGSSANHLYLTVADHGAGFDVESAMDKGGLGLLSMRERVRLVGGAIAIESKPTVGTTIRVCVPFGSEHSSQLEVR